MSERDSLKFVAVTTETTSDDYFPGFRTSSFGSLADNLPFMLAEQQTIPV